MKIPEGYELQAIGDKAAGADIYAKISTMSKFAEDKVELVITFQTKDGSVVYGTANEVLEHVTYTKDMVLGPFTYMGTYASNGKEYNLGQFTIVENPDAADSVYLTNFYLEGSVVPARIDLNAGKLYIASFEYIGIEVDEETPYYIFTYANSGADDIEFTMNSDGTLVTDDLTLVGTPDMQNVYYWFQSTHTEFIPVPADGSRIKGFKAMAAKATKANVQKGHKGSKIMKSFKNKNLKNKVRK